VRSLREALRETEIRAKMGRTMSRLLIATSLYTFALGIMLKIKPYLGTTLPISVFILLAFAISVIVNIRTSGFPASVYGFNTYNWQVAVKEAILLSLPVAALMVLAKAILIHTVPAMAGLPLLDFAGSSALTGWFAVLATAIYALFVPIQEIVARGVQSAMMLYLRGRFRVLLAIVIAALLFSATHLHTSLSLAVGAFLLGLFWGWLYWRNPTLIGVTLSHLMLGLFAFHVVGFPF
jgi:membrane protease YdiL (CAAX protease family)